MMPPGTRWTVSRAVAFAGLELIKRKSLIKHCLKLTVSEFLNFLLKGTEVLMVCLVLVLFVYFKAADFLQSILWDKNSCDSSIASKLLTSASPFCCLGIG